MDRYKSAKIWVPYMLLDNGSPKPDKIPINPFTLNGARSNDPATWGDYGSAYGCLGKRGSVTRALKGGGKEQAAGEISGVGFMFAGGICGIDLDDINSSPERKQQANEILAHMGSYSEVSPSGTGWHIIFRCDIDKLPKGCKESYYMKNARAGVECYISGLTNRFFTYTANTINNAGVEERTGQLTAFLEKYMRKNPFQKTEPPSFVGATTGGQIKNSTPRCKHDTAIIIEKARKARNGGKFSALFDHGDTSGYNGDDSGADIALCNIIAFYANGDPALIDEIFRQSALYRAKWERADYREATINKSIGICGGKFWCPPGRPKKESAPADTPAADAGIDPGAVYINPFATPEARQRYRWNDIGMGNLFADTFKDVSRYVPEAKEWYCYDGRVWRQDVGGVVVAQQAKRLTDYMLDCRRLIENDEVARNWVEFVGRRMKKTARDTMLADASSVYPLSVTKFDADPYLFNCLNGTLDLRDFTLHKHRPEDFLSKTSNVIFDKNAECARWTRFINEVTRGDMGNARFLQKALGYALTGDTSEECFFILYGSTTRNGKGTTMETALRIMGGYGRTAQPDTIATKQSANSGAPSEDIARLMGARFVNMPEPDKGLRLNSALVKQITGGDTVTARFLHQNSIEYRPEYKLFINTNHLPHVTDDSIFASGRVKLIPFERHFPEGEQDKGLKTLFRQPENVSGIFNWLIEGLKLARAEGLGQSEAGRRAAEQYRQDSDTIGLFIAECLEGAAGGKITAKAVHAEYARWCGANGYSPLNNRGLFLELRRKGMKIERSTGNNPHLFDYALRDSYA